MTCPGRVYLQNDIGRDQDYTSARLTHECVRLCWSKPSILFLLPSTSLTITDSLLIKVIYQPGTFSLCIISLNILLLFMATKKNVLFTDLKMGLRIWEMSPYLDLNSSWKEHFISEQLFLNSKQQHPILKGVLGLEGVLVPVTDIDLACE